MRDVVRLLLLRARSRGRLRATRDVHVAEGVRVTVARGARRVAGPLLGDADAAVIPTRPSAMSSLRCVRLFSRRHA